jgi:hypothetical protein
MEEVIRDSLEMLQREFERCAGVHPLLRHEQLIPPYLVKEGDGDEPSEEERTSGYAAFFAANSTAPDGQWQEWHGPVEGQTYEWCGRFFGGREGLSEFQHLAKSLYLVIRKIDPTLPVDGGYEACLDMMHISAANWPTTLLRSEESIWGAEHLSEEEKFSLCEVCDCRNGVAYFAHPSVETIQGNLFIAAAQFAKMIASDDLTLFLNDFHWTEPDYPTLSCDEVVPETEESFSKPIADSNSSTLTYDMQRHQWHIAFRYGPEPESVETDWWDDSAGLRYLAFILERPDQLIPYSEVLPNTSSAKSGMAAGSFVSGAESLYADGQPMSGANATQNEDIERKLKYYEKCKELRAEIEQPNSGLEKQELEEELNQVISEFNREYDKFGRIRMFLNKDQQNHRRRVGIGLDRFKKDYLSSEQSATKFGHFSAEFQRIQYRGKGSGGIRYLPSANVSWSVSLGQGR